jgi:hypothetical protein
MTDGLANIWMLNILFAGHAENDIWTGEYLNVTRMFTRMVVEHVRLYINGFSNY